MCDDSQNNFNIEEWRKLIVIFKRQKKEPQNYDLEQLDFNIKTIQKLIDDAEGGVC